MNRINTVNVIEVLYSNQWNVSVHSFPETTEGNKAAEELFHQIICENMDMLSSEDIARCLEDGVCEVGDGAILLVHSGGI